MTTLMLDGESIQVCPVTAAIVRAVIRRDAVIADLGAGEGDFHFGPTRVTLALGRRFPSEAVVDRAQMSA